MNKDNLTKIKEIIAPEYIKENANMSAYTSFRTGGIADYLVLPQSAEELTEVIAILNQGNEEFMVLGNGTNVLFSDNGYHGTVVRIGGPGLSEITVSGTTITAGAGALLSAIASTALREGLEGFEFASGIPGSAGGGLFMNAGAYGGEMSMIVSSAIVLNPLSGQLREVDVNDMELSYRHSAFMNSGEIVLKIKYNLKHGDVDNIRNTMKELAVKRNTKQPVNFPSAGSFFKRPEGYFAGKLVQDAGLKGLSVGGAQVSELHSGFVVNKGGATATDIVDLMHVVQNTVYDKFGVQLEPEVRIIGLKDDSNDR